MTDTARIPVIAIDGPVGSGKGTIARRVATALGWHLLDSGALYRLVALAAARHSIRLNRNFADGYDCLGTACLPGAHTRNNTNRFPHQ